MPRIAPVAESAASEKVQQTYARIKEMLNADAVPGIFLPFGASPALLHDFYMNFKKFVLTDGKLDARAKGLIAIAVSGALKCPAWVDFLADLGKQRGLTDQEVNDAVAIAATCAMYNVFFKFRDLSGNEAFTSMPVGLRAHAFSGTSLDDKTVELINVAVSDVNGCKPCTSGHVEKARQLGVTDDQLLETVQCAATMAAGCTFLNGAGY